MSHTPWKYSIQLVRQWIKQVNAKRGRIFYNQWKGLPDVHKEFLKFEMDQDLRTVQEESCNSFQNKISNTGLTLHWLKVIQSYVKITASFQCHSLLVLKYVPDQLPYQICTTCKCYLVCTWKTQASAAANVNMASRHAERYRYAQD